MRERHFDWAEEHERMCASWREAAAKDLLASCALFVRSVRVPHRITIQVARISVHPALFLCQSDCCIKDVQENGGVVRKQICPISSSSNTSSSRIVWYLSFLTVAQPFRLPWRKTWCCGTLAKNGLSRSRTVRHNILRNRARRDITGKGSVEMLTLTMIIRRASPYEDSIYISSEIKFCSVYTVISLRLHEKM